MWVLRRGISPLCPLHGLFFFFWGGWSSVRPSERNVFEPRHDVAELVHGLFAPGVLRLKHA